MSEVLEIETENASQDHIIEAGNYTFFVCRSNVPFILEKCLIYDAFIIEAGDYYFTLNVIKKIRSHVNPECYLKPVFLYKGSDNRDPLIHNLSDGVIFSYDQINFLIPVLEKIYLRIAEINPTKSISYEAQMIDKCLNLMFTREKTQLLPTPYIQSAIAYAYPELSVNFHARDEWQVLDLLQIMESEGLAQGEFYDRIYLCNGCSGAYLIFREVCPTCQSADNVSEDLVHHYPCAFIGPISDFKNELDDQLHCPKCNKNLRHIGVDYDKPSIIYTCNHCKSKFQDIHVQARCVSCNHDNPVENLAPRAIKNYRITKKGEMTAVTGYVSTSKDIEEFIGTIKIDTFKTMLKYEIERLKQNDYISNISAIYIRNAGELFSMIGTNSQRALLKDLVDIVRRNLRSADLITFLNVNTLILSMNEIPTKVAEHILKEIADIMTRLIRKNFKNFEADIRFKVQTLNTKLSHELQMQQLTYEFID